jgi:hypothetical protein
MVDPARTIAVGADPMRKQVFVSTLLAALITHRRVDAQQLEVHDPPNVVTTVEPTASSPNAPAPASALSEAERRELRLHHRIPYWGDVPPGMHVESRARTRTVIAGALIFGLPYAGALALAAATGDGWIAVPFGGPFYLAVRAFEAASAPCTAFCSPGLAFVTGVLSIADGVMQLGGAATLVAGLADRQLWLVPNAPQSRARARRPQWAALPGSAGAPVGFTLSVSTW